MNSFILVSYYITRAPISNVFRKFFEGKDLSKVTQTKLENNATCNLKS